jgi:tRNA G18 (ribose-2'-O)-methylase SpoU
VEKSEPAMPIIRVSDLGDSRLAEYRNMADARLARERGIFIAEGRLVVSRLLMSSRFAARSVMVTEAALASIDAPGGRGAATPVYVVPQPVMNGVTGLNIHRGCLAVGERRQPETIAAVTANARRIVVLERVANADNVGGIFRNAAAFGVDAVLLDKVSTDPLYRKAIRTSMGAALRMPFARADSIAAALTELRGLGFTAVALTPGADAEPLAAVAARHRSHRIALIVGHEGDGITAATLGACDLRARIPMAEAVDSLNVAAATAIALYELNDPART